MVNMGRNLNLSTSTGGPGGTVSAEHRRKPWVVLKFGGTSVATAENWKRIARRLGQLLPEHRTWIVVSALAGVSNRLEQAIGQARTGRQHASLRAIRATHEQLATDLGLTPEEFAPVADCLKTLRTWLTGVRLTGETPPRLVARIMALGELASSHLGAAALHRSGLALQWVDARQLLRSAPRASEDDHHRYLEAHVPACLSPELGEEAAAGSQIVMTQGFIAGTADNATCLLGRGGSDTSGALFAVLLGAQQLEIWTDVHGLFTADPRLLPTARLIRRLGYREAQELAAMGAKVLHPRCLEPVASASIPLSIHCTADPDKEGTLIEASLKEHPAVTAVTCRMGVTLLSLSTIEMWGAPGFLAHVFAPFEELGISIDLVATSQSTISVTLDKLPDGVQGAPFARLLERLERISQVTVVHPCAVVSIVGRRIRAVLHELGPAMSVFQERPVHLVSESAEDLNLSFVVDEADAQQLVVRLHERLFSAQGGDARFGPTFEVLGGGPLPADAAVAWWRRRRRGLIELMEDGRPRYVYHVPTIIDRARMLRRTLRSVDRLYYSMKANPHPRILQVVAQEGFGIECVSAAEVARAREVLGGSVPLLFTPNFCPMEEYALALSAAAEVVLDGPEPLEQAPGLFRGLGIGVRIDPGSGHGHHEKVRTAGSQAKFGHPLEDVPTLSAAIRAAGAKVVGLHAHVGSGIFDAETWAATGAELSSLLRVFSGVEWLDLGGGLGVPERPGQAALDLEALERGLAALKHAIGAVALRMEPGRFVVSEAGVLLAPVTQVRRKGGVKFVGLATGMNSLIRPALYGAWHGIHNLSRLDEAPDGYWQVVGPICETGDVLGRDRLLPQTSSGDVMLIENVGAYGAVMASRYNLREQAEEVVLEE